MTIKDYQEGAKIKQPLLIKQLTKGVTTAGSPYYSITFQDKTGTIEGKLWDANKSDINESHQGKVVEVQGEVLKYRHALQLKILSMTLLANHEYDLNDFISSGATPVSELKQYVQTTLENLKNPIMKHLVTEIINDQYEDYFQYPAASKNHHEFMSGLAAHVVGMLKIGNFLADIHPTINRDLLLSGILLHDIGKITELSGPILTEYTVEGKLLGHISIMNAQLQAKAIELGYQDSEEVMLLKHMILSHHGHLEFGSPVLPQIAEAEYLSFIDNLDSRINMLEKAMAQIEPGTFTPRIFSLENRSFYKPKLIDKTDK